MRQLLTLALAALSLIACTQKTIVPEDSVRELCEYTISTYPQATLQDLYKTCYQDFFGPGHMVTDTASALGYIHYEVEEIRSSENVSISEIADEATGFRHRFVRLDLRRIVLGQMSEEELLHRFIETANTATPVHDNWADEWAQIEAIALHVHPAWRNDELQALLHQAAAGNHAVHHSEPFRNTYKPHYRIIRL